MRGQGGGKIRATRASPGKIDKHASAIGNSLQRIVLHWQLDAWRDHILARKRAEDLRREIVRRRHRRAMSLAVAFWQHTVHRNKLRRQLATTSAHKALKRRWCSWLKSVSAAREVASLMVEVTGLLNEVSVIQIKV